MTLIDKFNDFIRNKIRYLSNQRLSKHRILNINLVSLLGLITVITIIFFSITNYIFNKNVENQSNLKKISSSSEFLNLTNYFISKINSLYGEIKYLINSYLSR